MSEKNIEAIYPLSPMQQGILFQTLYAPASRSYFVQFVCSINSRLNTSAFKHAWQFIIDRHPVLRTAFVWEGFDEPLQVVGKHITLPWEQQDWRELGALQQQEQFESFLKADRENGFDLSQAPLMRCALIQLSDSSFRFIWSHHHLLLDGWSVSRLLNEVVACYEAFDADREPELRYNRPYADYIRWLQQQDASQAETFWREMLKGFTAPTAVNVDRLPGKGPSRREDHAEQSLVVPEDVTSSLQSLARNHKLTVSTLAQGAWAQILSHYSGELDVVFGSVVSGRQADLPDIESMIGLFINTLPARAQLSPESLLIPWLQNFQARQIQARQYEYSSLVQVQGWSEVPRGIPLFETLLIFENYEPAGSSPPTSGLRFRDAQILEWDHYPLSVMIDTGAEWLIKIGYDSLRFDAETIARMLQHFVVLLESMAENPRQRLWQLPLLSRTEKQQLLFDFNNTEQFYPADKCLHHLFADQVAKTPDAIALVFGKERFTYAGLNAKAKDLARHLQALGVGLEARVAVFMDRSIEMVIGLLGILKAGGAYVPCDPTYPKERLSFMLADANASVILTQRHLIAALPDHQAQILCLDGDWSLSAPEHEEPALSWCLPDNIAYTIYTSGSTGKPKGVQVTHRAVVNFLSSMSKLLELKEDDVLLAVTTLSFDIAALEIFLPLSLGARVEIASREIASDGRLLLKQLTESGITAMQATPATWRLLLESGWQGGGQLKVFCGGEALPAELADELLEKSESLWNLYGPTESTIWSAACKIEYIDGNVSIGKPIGNTQLYIVDERVQAMAIGIAGELLIGGDGLARGYLERAELTAERFIPDAFGKSEGGRLYRTGDLVRYLRDGSVEYIGRSDQQVKVRGYRIELGEVEAALREHPEVKEAVAVVREEEGEKRLVGYIVSEGEGEVEVRELREYLKGRLPEYMIPGSFVKLAHLPLTPNHKVDRKALPAPDDMLYRRQEYLLSPRTPIEELLVSIWSKVFGAKRISINDSFFDLGGHSLLATRIVSHLREVFDVEVSLSQIFESPTIAGLAESVEKLLKHGQTRQLPSVERISRQGELPLSFAQQRFWFLNQLTPGSALYNIPIAMRLHGAINYAALQDSFHKVVQRHESLQAAFPCVEGQPVQVLTENEPLMFSLIDLSGFSQLETEGKMADCVNDLARYPFSLDEYPLFRVALIRLTEQEHVLVLTLHHIIFDAWSAAILIRELSAFYHASCTGESAQLLELPIKYADFAYWQQQWLQGDALEAELGHWKQRLDGASFVLELPTDRPRPPVATYCGATLPFSLPVELSDSLNALSREEQATLYITLLSGFKAMLYRYTGQPQIIVGTAISNRNRVELEGVIGPFINNLMFNTDLSGDPGFRELLGRVRKVALDSYTHHDLPFEKLVEALQPNRNLNQPPLFQVALTLHNTPSAEPAFFDLKVSPLDATSGTSKLDVAMNMMEAPEGLIGTIEYNTDIFDESTMARLLGHFRTILDGAVKYPDRRLSSLPFLTEAERLQLLCWNETAASYPRGKCVNQLIEAQVERSPDAIALRFQDQELSYRNLNHRANQLARYLQKLGAGPEMRIAVCIDRSPEMIIGILGVIKAGAAYVPLDHTYPLDRIGFMLEDAQASLLLGQEQLIDSLPTFWAQAVCIDADWELIAQEDDGNLDTIATDQNLAYVIYTSGSSGKPKGVLIQHGGLCNLTETMAQDFRYKPDSRVLQFASLSFDASAAEIFTSLVAGVTLCLAPKDSLLPGPALSWLLQEQRITNVTLPPSALAAMQVKPFPYLHTLVVAGEACPATIAAYWGQDREFLNAYGPTEATVCATVGDSKDSAGSPSIGRPVSNTQLYIVDERVQAVAIGIAGELLIGGDGLARGYLERAELTAERFIPDAFGKSEGGRLYRTGDLVRYLRDGSVEYIGRSDQQVKVRGYRIELGEVEAALREHPEVKEAVAVVREEEGEKRLVGYIVSEGEGEVEVRELREYLKGRLPEYMIPGSFVKLEHLPLTPNHKIDRRALPASGDSHLKLGTGFREPRDLVELELVRVWEEVLDKHPIGISDSFFDLGGHSLLAVRLLGQIQNRHRKEVPLPVFFQKPTIEYLAGLLREGAESLEQSPLVAMQPLGSRPPLFCVHPGSGNVLCYVDLAQRLGVDQPFYGLRDVTLDNGTVMWTTVEEMATRYIEAIRQVQPYGPYLLGGYSFGAVVAFEMAQQLRRHGDDVDLLAILDAGAPAFSSGRFEGADDMVLLAIIACDLARNTGKTWQALAEDLRELEPKEQLNFVLNYVIEQTNSRNLFQGNVLDYIQAQLQVFKVRIKVVEQYAPRTYDSRLVLFQSKETEDMLLSESFSDTSMGWNQLCAEPVEIHVIEGHHSSITDEPHVRILAELLKSCLDQPASVKVEQL